MLKSYEKNIWMDDLGATYLQSIPFQCTLSVTQVAFLVAWLMKECFQPNPIQGTKLKYVAMQLNTSANFIQKFESDMI